MLTLHELTRQVAKELRKGGIWEGTSTAATDTTITDAIIGLAAGTVDGGTIWFLSGGVGITGESRVITTQAAGGVVTWSPAIAMGAVEVLNYMIFGKTWPRHALRDAVNRALQNIGEFADYDATLDSVSLQEDYAIPATVTSRIMSVEISAYPDPAGVPNPNWRLHQAFDQFEDTLRFLANPPVWDGVNNIRLGFNIMHPTLVADADQIRREVIPTRLKWEAVAEAYMHLLGPRDSVSLDEQTQNLYNRAVSRANEFPAHINQPLPEPMLFLGVGSRGSSLINPDSMV